MKNFFVYGMSGSGKDTISDYLRYKYGYNKLRIASTIKQVITEKYGISFEELEVLKRTDKKFRDEHHIISAMLGNEKASLSRCDLIVRRKSMDFQLIDTDKPIVICDCRTINEMQIFLTHDYYGIVLTRKTAEYKNPNHYTESNLGVETFLEYASKTSGKIFTVHNNDDNDDKNPDIKKLPNNYVTNGKLFELQNTIDLIIKNIGNGQIQ